MAADEEEQKTHRMITSDLSVEKITGVDTSKYRAPSPPKAKTVDDAPVEKLPVDLFKSIFESDSDDDDDNEEEEKKAEKADKDSAATQKSHEVAAGEAATPMDVADAAKDGDSMDLETETKLEEKSQAAEQEASSKEENKEDAEEDTKPKLSAKQLMENLFLDLEEDAALEVQASKSANLLAASAPAPPSLLKRQVI